MKGQSKAFEIALSAVACAIATAFLSLGLLTPYLLATGYVVACFALMLPLSKKMVWGNVLAYVATILLSLLIGGGFVYFWKLLPFIVFFGLHPLVNHLELRFRWNKIIAIVLKALWFDGAMYLCWRFTFDMTLAIEWLNDYIIPLILGGGTVFFFVYDNMIFGCQRSVDKIVKRIKR